MRWQLEHILKKEGGGILLEDDSLIVLNKPSGLLVLPDRYEHAKRNLLTLLKDSIGSTFVVHRIDRETSGVILFAKTAEAHAALNAAFEQRHVEKRYQALVIGTPESESGIITLPLSENEHGVSKMRIDKRKGKDSTTEYTVLERFQGYALLELKPYTGRRHQIRVHLSAIGLPILADSLYGNEKGFYLSKIKRGYRNQEEEHPLIERTALHAASLRVQHPVSDQELFMQAPLPKDMVSVIKALRKYQGI
jgi:23S rRNA pseudouridine1911/1915/1917 synthase